MPNHITDPLLHLLDWAPSLSLSYRGHLVPHLFINAWRRGECVTHAHTHIFSFPHTATYLW